MLFNDQGEYIPPLIIWITHPSQITHCERCAEVTTWVRCTQFGGDHQFCDEHARQEENFGKEDPSYFYWMTAEDLRDAYYDSMEYE